MSEAAPRAVSRMTTAQVAQWLDVLWAVWEDCYFVGCDDRGWWASRRGVIGSFMRADTPQELGRLIEDDFGAVTL